MKAILRLSSSRSDPSPTPDGRAGAEPRQAGEGSYPWPRASRHDRTNDVLLDTTLTWMARLPKDGAPMVLAPTLSTDCEQYCRHLAARRPLRRVPGRSGRRSPRQSHRLSARRGPGVEQPQGLLRGAASRQSFRLGSGTATRAGCAWPSAQGPAPTSALLRVGQARFVAAPFPRHKRFVCRQRRSVCRQRRPRAEITLPQGGVL